MSLKRMGNNMKIIAGPCQHETIDQSLEIAKECKRVCDKYGYDYYFKASYDKANRTSINSERGRGMMPTLAEIEMVKSKLPGLKYLTDVHSVHSVHTIEASPYRNVVDVYQIPAFLCRQTDLITAAAAIGKPMNVKKGQFLAPWDASHIIEKAKAIKSNIDIWITERGTSFGYNQLVVDFTGIQYMLKHLSVPIIFDATHSVQRPGGEGLSSGGDRTLVGGLCRAASALGVTNFFLEVHPDPDNAPSDGPNMIKLNDFERVIDDIHRYSYTG